MHIQGLTPLLLERIECLPGLAAAYLFGSAAKGTISAGSDLDIALLFTDFKKDKIDKLSIMASLSDATGRDVDVVLLNEAGPLLFHEILASGRLIVEKNRHSRVHYEVKSRKYFDDYSYLHSSYMKGMRARYDR